MAAFVALLRGINVGGNKLVKMAALKALCEAAGFERVRTLLQSGNIVFTTTGRPADIADTLTAAIAAEFGFEVSVFVRTARELEATVRGNPFPRKATDDPGHLLVMFVDRDPAKEEVDGLVADHDGPERIICGHRALYLTYPDGIGRSKLTNTVLEKRLGLSGTSRNWNTVTKLLAMTAEAEAG